MRTKEDNNKKDKFVEAHDHDPREGTRHRSACTHVYRGRTVAMPRQLVRTCDTCRPMLRCKPAQHAWSRAAQRAAAQQAQWCAADDSARRMRSTANQRRQAKGGARHDTTRHHMSYSSPHLFSFIPPFHHRTPNIHSSTLLRACMLHTVLTSSNRPPLCLSECHGPFQ